MGNVTLLLPIQLNPYRFLIHLKRNFRIVHVIRVIPGLGMEASSKPKSQQMTSTTRNSISIEYSISIVSVSYFPALSVSYAVQLMLCINTECAI